MSACEGRIKKGDSNRVGSMRHRFNHACDDEPMLGG